MSKLKIIGIIGAGILFLLVLNWIRKHEFIDIFSTIFILFSLGVLTLSGLYIYNEVTN